MSLDVISFSKANKALKTAIKNKIDRWNPDTLYKVDKLIIHESKLYICTVEHTSTTTFSTINWELIVCGSGTSTEQGLIGTKQVDETNLNDNYILVYSATDDKYIPIEQRNKVYQWEVNHHYEQYEIVVFDNILHWIMQNHTSSNDIELDINNNLLIPFVTEAGFSNVIDFQYVIQNNGTEVLMTWKNPAETTYEGRILYFSETHDLSALNKQNCDELVANGNATILTSGLGTGADMNDSFTQPISTRKSYYVKVFVAHYNAETSSTLYSSGRYLEILNPDTYAPIPPSDLSIDWKETEATLTWTQPTDLDFMHTKVIRNINHQPLSPTDGLLVATVSGIGTFTDTDIAIGNRYYYSLFVYDDAGDGYQTGVEGNWETSIGSQGNIDIVDRSISNLTVEKTKTDGTELTLNWTNPITTYSEIELYCSTVKDISTFTRQQCSDDLDVTLVVIPNGTSQHTLTTTAELTYSFATFVKYVSIYDYSEGKYTSIFTSPTAYNGYITNLNVNSTSSSVSFTWQDPQDLLYQGTSVRYKVGSYPIDNTDGIHLGNFSRDEHSTSPLTISNLTSNSEVYVRLFPFDKYNNVSTNALNQFTSTTYPTYGFRMSTGERLMDAATLSSSDFNNLYPWNSIGRCVINDSGVVQYYLNDIDSTLKEDGTLANLDGTDGQIVSEIPSFYYKFDGDDIYFTEKQSEGFTLFPKTYIGAYESSLNVDKLQSVSGVLPDTGKGLVEYRNLAQARGLGWDIVDFETGNVFNYLFFVKYANSNSQSVLGQGITNNTAIQVTGGTNTLGNQDSSTTDTHVNLFGIENIYGNTFECRHGLISKDDAYYINGVATTDIPITNSGFISSFNDKLIADEVLGADNTFVGDYHNAHVSGKENYSLHGGHYTDGTKAGLSRLHLGATYSEPNQYMTQVETLTNGNIHEYTLDLTQYDDVVKLSSISLEDQETQIKVNLTKSYPNVGARLIYR